MSFLKKLKESLRDPAIPKRTINVAPPRPITPIKKKIDHQYVDFSMAYRIGILGYLNTNSADQKKYLDYKRELEKLGYDCEVLLFLNQDDKDPNVYLPSFNKSNLSKEGIPNAPATDRFIIRRFDILMNLFFEPNPQLLHLSNHSNAKCRVSPYQEFFTPYSDLLIPTPENDIHLLIKNINKTLKLQPYVRPEI